MKIKDIIIREIYDSRAEPTIEVGVVTEDGTTLAQIPSGKSRGSREAAVLPYAEAKKAVEEKLLPAIVNQEFTSIRGMDEFLVACDGTENKKNLGGNVTLGISVAFARALAKERGQALWETLRGEFFKEEHTKHLPLIFSNFINGGAHAGNNLAFQEYLVIAHPKASLKKSIRDLIALFKDLGVFLRGKAPGGKIPIGDEGGYAPDFADNFEPISILEEKITALGFEKEFTIGIDTAANSFHKSGAYLFEGKEITTEELSAIYLYFLEHAKFLVSLEDPFAEDDVRGFRLLVGKAKGKLVIGDDLTVTNASRILRSAENNEISGVIIKPNQIGTVMESCEAIRTAKKYGEKCIVSHRSGETEDNFIVHLARAANADGVKIGAPQRERIFKFNELVRVYEG